MLVGCRWLWIVLLELGRRQLLLWTWGISCNGFGIEFLGGWSIERIHDKPDLI